MKFIIIFYLLLLNCLGSIISGVAGLNCFHCIHLGESLKTRQPHHLLLRPDESCETSTPAPELSVDCSSLVDPMINIKRDNITTEVLGLEGVMSLISEPSGTKQNQVKFTCARFLFDGYSPVIEEKVRITVRTCLATTRPTGFTDSCQAGKLKNVQKRVEEPEVALALAEIRGRFYNGKTRTESCTCNDDNCNGAQMPSLSLWVALVSVALPMLIKLV